MSIPELYTYFIKNPVVCTDTRKILPESIFFALKGDNFNGNKFAKSALENGCSLAIVDEKEFATSPQIILVPNVLKCLQDLASYHRKQWGKKILAITGSNGKTTTKELIHNVLKQKINCLATVGNLNNHIGVPLTLLAINNSHDFAIVEMGANHQQEIAELCEIAKPDFGIITNVGKAHLEGFGGEEGIIKGKGELYDYLKKNGGLIFINGDDEKLIAISNGINSIKYGYSNANQVKGQITDSGLFLKMKIQSENSSVEISSNLTGLYNGLNILCAAAVGLKLNLTIDEIKKGIESYQPDNSRSQIKKFNTNTLILDAYNANPSSMNLAIENIATIKADNKLLIIGDMLEMGNYSKDEHLKILRKVVDLKLNAIFIGKQFSEFKNEFSFKFFENSTEAKLFLQENKIKDSLVLIKGSRGVKLEQVLDTF